MSDIFISYASEDRQTAQVLAKAFEAQGWLVWWDRTIPAGGRYHQVIEDALTSARCVVVIWSRESVGSDWVRAEAEEGMRRNILVPVCIDGSKPPLIFRQIQTLDLSQWKGTAAHPTLDRLYADLHALLGSRAPDQRPPGREEPKPRRLLRLVPLTIVVCGILGLIFAVTWFVKKDDNHSPETASKTPEVKVEKEGPHKSDNRPPPPATIGPGILLAENLDAKGKLVLLDRSQNKVTWEKAFGSIRCLSQTQLGEIIVCDEERIVKMARNGEILSSVANREFNALNRATEVNDGSLLLSSGTFNWVRQIDWNGQTKWSVLSKLHFPSDAQRLPDGNTLIADGTSDLKIVAGNGQIVQTIPLSNFACTVSRLRNQYTVVGLSGTVVLLDENNNT